jgi:hypothetical protein
MSKKIIQISSKINRAGYHVAEIMDMKSCTGCIPSAPRCARMWSSRCSNDKLPPLSYPQGKNFRNNQKTTPGEEDFLSKTSLVNGNEAIAMGAIEAGCRFYFGYPIRMAELLGRAFEVQIKREGFAFIEFLSACPTNWKMSPRQAMEKVTKEMGPYYPLGIL